MIIIYILITLFIIWAGITIYIQKTIEIPEYSVIENNIGYEVREYKPYIKAITTVESSDYRQATNEGFRRLADYIFGNNSSQDKITMTAPVEAQKTSEKIAMTAPVNIEQNENSFEISFIMPSEYTMQNLPKPNSDIVKIIEMPSQKFAVLRFNWYPTNSRVTKKTEQLLSTLQENNIVIIGNPITAVYNPPLSNPFFHRNEILIPIR